MPGTTFRQATADERKRSRVRWLLALGTLMLGALLSVATDATAVFYDARASLAPRIYYIGDSAGDVYTFTVKNTGTSTNIGAVEIARPTTGWQIVRCPNGPYGWSASVSTTKCRYRSRATLDDDIKPGQSKTFGVKAKTSPGTTNRTGTWRVTVSSVNHFNTPSRLKAAPAMGGGLTTTLYTFQLTGAVVTDALVPPGSACPPANKSALVSSSKTIVICGKNRATANLTPSSTYSSLGGTFIGTPGVFLSGLIPHNSGNVVLADWNATQITSVFGPGKKVIASIGASAARTSALRTFTGYNATSQPPDANDDAYSTNEDTPLSVLAGAGVLANDTDPESDPLTAGNASDPANGSVTLNADGSFSYTPDANFFGTDTFTYTANDTHQDSPPATVTITVNSVNDVPDAVNDARSISEDSTATTVDVLGNDTDADTTDTLAVTAVDTTGTTGTVTNNGTDVTYDPNGQFEGLTTGQTATDTFTYTVSDGHGGTDTATVTVTILGSNDTPVAVNDTGSTDEASTVQVNVAANDSDAEGAFTVTTVNTTGTLGTVTNNNDGTVTYDPNGAFESLAAGEDDTDTFTYTIQDTHGATDTATVTVTVNGINDPPVAVDDGPSISEDSTGTTVNVLGNDTDADTSDTLTVTAVDTTGTTGTVTNNGTDVTYDPNGMFEYLTTGQTASDVFTYTVSDGNGGTDTATVTVTVTGVNDLPVAVDDSDSTDEASTVQVNVVANDTDAEGAITVTGVDTTGTDGTVTNNNDGTVTYDPNGAFEHLGAGDTEDDTFTYTITDGNGATDTATVTVTVNGINDPPVAVDDGPSISEDSTGTTVNVLGNDTDADADTLAVTAVDTTGTTGLVTNNGTDVTYDPNGMFEYLTTGQTATDTFTYTVSDGNGGTDTATVTVTVTGVNDLPVAVDDSDSTDEASTVQVNVVANDTDAEGAITVTGVDTTGTDGTVTNNNDGTVTYDPNGAFEHLGAGDTEDDTFTYTITDGNGATDTATVTVTVNGINDPPVAVDDGPSISEDSTGTTVNVLGNDTDADADTLAVTAVDTTGTTGTVTNNGTDVTYDPNGMFEYLTTGQTATDTFTYTVSDGNGGTDTATVTVTVTGVNDPPVAVDDSDSTDEASTVLVNLLTNDTDAEGAVTVTAIDTTGTDGTVTNNNDGTVTYDPNGAFEDLANGDSENDTFTYTITDGNGATDTATVTVTVNGINDPPVATDDAQNVPEDSTGATVDVLGNDTDAESQTLTVTAVDTTGTTGLVTNNGTDVTYDPNGMFEYLDAGETATDSFTYTTTDSQGGTDTATVTITVTGANDPVVAVDDAYQTVVDTQLVVTAPGVLANDTDADTSDTVTAGNASDPPNGTVTLDPDGSFVYTPDSGYLGPDSFTYDATDGTTTDSATVSITVVPPNDTPTADPASASGDEDNGAITVNLAGDDTDGDALTFSVGTATNGTVGTPTTPVCDSNPTNHCTSTVTYTPNADFFGSDSFTYTVNDGTVSSAPATASITVNPVNDAPSFTKGADETVNEDSGAQSVTGWATAISPGPANESAQTVSFVVTTDNDPLFSALPAVSPAGDLTYTPAPDAFGSATVTVKVTDSDGGESATQQFLITVNPVNDVPSFTKGADQNLNEDPGAQSVSGWATAISKGPANESAQNVLFTVTNDNNPLFSGQPAVSPTGTLTYTPAANAVGSATVSVSISDDGGIANGGVDTSAVQMFTITVNPVNDPPTFTHDGDQTVLEDSGAQSVAGFINSKSAGPSDESAQVVTVSVTLPTSNDALFSVLPALDSAGTLTYTPAANQYGSATVTMSVSDDGGILNGGDDTGTDQTFVITVTPVNDEPSFVKGADQNLDEDSGAQSVSGWATSIGEGPNEAAQDVTFVVTNDNNTLFSAQPAVSPTGTLTYTSAPNLYGTATVSVKITDNGGILNGGDDESPIQMFTITVNPVNDAPVAAAKAFTVQANMKISLGGLLTGATDPSDVAGDAGWTPSFTVGTVFVGAGCIGCTVSNVNTAAGTFDFDPPAGGTGSFTLSYTVVDNGFPAPGATSAGATITFTVNGPVIWFVDTTLGAAGTGRLSAPYNTLAAATTAMGSNTNQRIFVDNGNATGNVTLPTDGWLISDAVTGASFDAVMGITPPAGTIARPGIASGTQRDLTGTVTVGTNSNVRGFDLIPTASNKGLVGNGKTGLVVNQMTITTSGARAVDLLSSSGVFSLTRVDSNGGDRGISLDTVNVSTGSFEITGSGSAGTGGTVTNATAQGATSVAHDGGVYLDDTKNVTLKWMTITSNDGQGISGHDVTTFVLEDSTVSDNGVNENLDHDGIRFDNLLGTSALTRVTVFGSREDNVRFDNTSGTANITVANSTIRDNNNTIGANGILVHPTGSANVTFTSTTNTLQRNHTDGILVLAESSVKTVATITDSTIVTDNGVGLDMFGNGTGGMQFTVDGGSVTGCATCGAPIIVYKGTLSTGTGASAFTGTVNDMTVSNASSTNAPGIWVHGEGPGEARIAVTNNTVTGVAHNGILSSFGNNSGVSTTGPQSVHVTITGNTITLPNVIGVLEGIFADSGLLSADTTQTCAHISGNTVSNPGEDDVRVRNRQAGTGMRLPGYVGGATDHTAVANFLEAQNTIADAFSSANAGSNGILGGAACTAP